MLVVMIPGLNTMCGLVPIHGNDVWLHLVLAGVAAYFGFVATATATTADETSRRRATVR